MTLQLTSVQRQRIARKSRPKPEQPGLFDEPPAPPPAPAAQSPRALSVAFETMMQAEAKRALNEKAAKAGKPAVKAPKVKPKVLTS